jgi:hypothetical protein
MIDAFEASVRALLGEPAVERPAPPGPNPGSGEGGPRGASSERIPGGPTGDPLLAALTRVLRGGS